MHISLIPELEAGEAQVLRGLNFDSDLRMDKKGRFRSATK